MIVAGTPTRIDWFRVFEDLKREGWSLYQIEINQGTSKSTLMGWRAGAEPKHADGERLIDLWVSVTGKARDQLPTERRYPNAYRRK